MSSGSRQTKDSIDFIDRLIEACGSSKAADIQRLLDISYQTAKNYLNGRLPHPEILIRISDRTDHSIDWLLTGRGDKLARPNLTTESPIPAIQLRTFVHDICLEVINEHIDSSAKTIVLHSNDLMSEKILENSNFLARINS